MVGRSSLLFNICPGFEEPLALDISFIHNINPPQLVPTNAVNAVMPYNTTTPLPSWGTFSSVKLLINSSLRAYPPRPPLLAIIPPQHRLLLPLLFEKQNLFAHYHILVSNRPSSLHSPPKADHVPTGSYFSMLSGRCTRGRVSVL